MHYAESISEIAQAFAPSSLDGEDLERFYYGHTMEVRTGDPYNSPIRDIFDACKMPSQGNLFLLLGHRGCGKTTELNEMKARMIQEGHQVRMMMCGTAMDLMNPAFADILILMGQELLEIAERIQIRPDPVAERIIREYWIDVERERIISQENGAELDAGIEAGRKIFVLPLLKLFATAKADLRYNEQNRTIYRQQIKKQAGEWIDAINRIAMQIAEKCGGKQPIIICEDIDKINPAEAWKVFEGHSEKLMGIAFPVIITFPIALSYDPRFRVFDNYFNVKIFPMIKLKNCDGSPYQAGLDAVWKIVQMRSDTGLFAPEALKLIIRMTGGCLRDLFSAICASAMRALRRSEHQETEAERICMEDAKAALEQQKSFLTRRIERKDFGFLAEIYRGNRVNIEDTNTLLRMLLAGVVLEYNGERWHDLHPLIAEYMEEQHLTDERWQGREE